MRGDALGSGVLRGEHARSPLVAGRARSRRQLLVDGAANDRVHEPQRPALGQDPAAAQRVGRFGRLANVQVRERGSVSDQGAVADDRRRAGEPLGRHGEPSEPRPDRRDDPVRRSAEHVRGAIRAGLAQRARELAQEERVPARQRVAGTAERRDRLGDSRTHELRRRLVAKRRRAHQRGRASLRQHRGDSGAAGLAERPRGDDEQDRSVAEPPCEIRQKPQRRRVGPVRIVDEQRERPVAGEVCRHAVQPVQDGERSLRPERQGGGLREWECRAAPPHGAPRPRRPPRRRRRGPRARAAAARPRTRTRARARSREPRAASALPRARVRAPRRPVRSCRSPPDPPPPTRAPHPPPRLRRPHGSRQAQRSAPPARPARRAPSSCSVGSSGPGDSTAAPLLEREGSTASRRRGRDHRALRLVKPLIGESVSARRALASSAIAPGAAGSPRSPRASVAPAITPLLEPPARRSPQASALRFGTPSSARSWRGGPQRFLRLPGPPRPVSAARAASRRALGDDAHRTLGSPEGSFEFSARA